MATEPEDTRIGTPQRPDNAPSVKDPDEFEWFDIHISGNMVTVDGVGTVEAESVDPGDTTAAALSLIEATKGVPVTSIRLNVVRI